MLIYFKKSKNKINAQKLAHLYKKVYLSKAKEKDIEKLILDSKLQYMIIYNAVKTYI